MLVQAALLLVGMLGIAALVVDLGIVRATQGSMVVAADAAALEGLRQRDALADSPRRIAAARSALAVFSTGGEAILSGAGPQLATGTGALADSAAGVLTNDGPFLPLLQSNLANAREGDLVAGAYITNPGVRDWHSEATDYSRQDFAVSAAADVSNARAFLARIRRTRDAQGLDRQAGISSSGPTLPFLFGFGSGISSADPDAYDPKLDGLTVRATAIADSRVAVAAGLSRPGASGVLPLGIDAVDGTVTRILAFDDFSWRTNAAIGGAFSVEATVAGTITGAGPSPDLAGIAQPSLSLARVGDLLLDVAEPLVFLANLAATIDPALVYYVALYSVVDGATRITGFAAVGTLTATESFDGDGNAIWTLSGTKLGSIVAPENASAVPSLATNLNALLPESPDRGELLAPVLAR